MAMLGVTHWTRRDATERALLGQAALDLCKALRAADGVDDSRFYWTGPDSIVIQVTAQSPDPIMQPPSADAARQLFALADLARREHFEQWIDPRTGMAQYDMAGR
jgi:hypothetical protein